MANKESVEELKEKLCQAIDDNSSELFELSKKIWENPELAFKEYKAHTLLTEFLDQHGFMVERKYILETGFRACNTNSTKKGLQIGLMCEYDALPDIGHACGHNLIAEAAVAAALGLKFILDAYPEMGQVVVFGTPAEEEGGGKVIMDKEGCFNEMDICLMVHPAPITWNDPPGVAASNIVITFYGKAAHVAAFPWEGINALHAAVALYNSMGLLKQQIKPTWHFHGIITKGGSQVNVITEESELVYRLYAPTKKELEQFLEKVHSCCEAAAKMTGCKVETKLNTQYHNVLHNPTLVSLYSNHLKNLEGASNTTHIPGRFSTDMGNVSFVKPSIHPVYAINAKVSNHHKDFTAAAGTVEAHCATIKAAKAMALTALDVLFNSDLMGQINFEFEERLKEQI